MTQSLYDPSTGTWYNYDEGSPGAPGEGGVLPSLVQAVSGAPYSGPNLVPETGGSASGTAAQILASEFRDWQKTYKPVELNLLNQTSLQNPGVLNDAVNKASTSVNQTYDAMAGVQGRQMAARGIVPTQQQAATSARLTGLSRAASLAGAQNQARQNVATQDELIALGSAPNPNIVQQSQNAKYAG